MVNSIGYIIKLPEFLMKKTTSVNELSKRTTCKKNCQKRPPLGGGKSGQLTRGTCRHWQSRHVLAVNEFFLHVIFFDNPLVKVVFFVKNSNCPNYLAMHPSIIV
jgi:hypothetical protein